MADLISAKYTIGLRKIMTRRAKIFAIAYMIIAILASLSILMYIVDNLEHNFITIMEKNSLIFQDKVIKINDVLESEGKKANMLINLEDLPERFEESIHKDMPKYFAYDKEKDIFHLDNVKNSNLDIEEISNITGKGNLDFLEDKENLKTLEVYLLFFMNKELQWLNERLPSSDWIYYTSLNRMASMREKTDEFVTSDIFTYSDEMLEYSFITDGYKENLKDREQVYWSDTYVDLAGKGTMITSSYPVDYKGEYIGSISIDFLANTLSTILDEKYITFLVDEQGSVFATNVKGADLEHQLKSIDDFKVGITFDDLKGMEYDKITNINGDNVMAHLLEGSPYTIYQIYTKESYFLDTAVDFSPVFLIFVFFAATFTMLRKVRESEKRLKVTLRELEQKQEELDYISRFDTLTNIYNRRGFNSEINTMETEGLLIGSSVILFDIDHFKSVNDTYGHDVGDEVLTEVCLVVKKYIGENEIFARYGGEEFIIVSKGTSLEKTCEIAENIRAGVASHNFKTINNLTVSLGVSTFRRKDTKDTWTTNADSALYKAKNDGRNKVYYYESYEFIGYSNREL